uniref:Uncharacterized protein n=1 Tax=Hyaloperonospora arabidopsidis (strain Emoy2) TaxID=559515 RepID=M4BMU4_HYAAE
MNSTRELLDGQRILCSRDHHGQLRGIQRSPCWITQGTFLQLTRAPRRWG